MAVEMIVGALLAGAAAGASASASTAVLDAYNKLKEGVGGLLRNSRGQPVGEDSEGDDDFMAGVEADPQAGRQKLIAALAAAGASEDRELLAAAEQLLTLVDLDRAQFGKYRVHAEGNIGMQVGDGNSMTLDYGR